MPLDNKIACQILTSLHDGGDGPSISRPFELRLMADVGDADEEGSEVDGGSYEPQTLDLTDVDTTNTGGCTQTNDGDIEFSDMPELDQGIEGWAIYDDDDTRIWWGEFDESPRVPEGETFTILDQTLKIGFGGA